MKDANEGRPNQELYCRQAAVDPSADSLYLAASFEVRRLPLSAVDSLGPAFEHSKQQLIRPFRFGQWARLALIGLMAGELSSGGGCNFSGFNVPIPQHTGGSDHFLPGLWSTNPVLFAVLIALLAVLVVALWLVAIYINSVARFVLFDSVVEKECHIRKGWSRRTAPGLRYFLWQILFSLVMLVCMAILIGIPALIAVAMGWFNDPGQHLLPLILGGVLLFFVFFAFIVLAIVVQVLTKDFVVPQMALEGISAIEGWRRLLRMVNGEKGGYAAYLGMKIVMALGAAVIVGIVAGIAMFILLIPIGGFGVVAVLLGKAAGLTWNLYTITLAVVVGAIAVAILLYAMALVSVPVIIFFPAYSIYFFAARYPALAAVLHPAPAPPEPPPLPPSPAPIG